MKNKIICNFQFVIRNYFTIFSSLFLICNFQFVICNLYGAFEEREISARIIGLSGVSVGLADDVNAIVYNPAGLASLDHLKFQTSYSNLYGILDYGCFGFASPLPWKIRKFGVMGFSSESFGFKDQYKENKLYFSHGIDILKNVSLGCSFKFFDLKILCDEKYTQKSIISFDIAGCLKIKDELTIGAIITNLNNPKITDGETLQMNYKFGIGYKPIETFIVAIDYEPQNVWKIGFEFEPHRIFIIRSGIRIPNIFSLGFGLNIWKLAFDIGLSYHPHLEFHQIVTLSFAYKFPKKIVKPVEKEIKQKEIKEEKIEIIPEEIIEIPETPKPEIPKKEPKKEEIDEFEEIDQKNFYDEYEETEPEIKPTKEEKQEVTAKKININIANEKELSTLLLSEHVIKNIIRYRKYKGKFKNVEELKKVPGVTKEIYESIKDKIIVE